MKGESTSTDRPTDLHSCQRKMDDKDDKHEERKLNQRETILNSNWKMFCRHCSVPVVKPFFIWMHCRTDREMSSVYTLIHKYLNKRTNIYNKTWKNWRKEQKKQKQQQKISEQVCSYSFPGAESREPRAGSQQRGFFFSSFFHFIIIRRHSFAFGFVFVTICFPQLLISLLLKCYLW